MYLVDIHPTARSLIIMLDKATHHANRCMQDYFKYGKDRWDKSHKPSDFKVGDLVLVSTLRFTNIKGPNNLKDSFSGSVIIREIHFPNAVQLELTGDLMKKHPSFPVSVLRPYISSDKELFPLRNKTPL
ncbi:hypothetical protein O181_062015 [Austropuccinia psidii MF-1]|uniref:Uncharacterized protein n=1 Tax=Austropuccinia psidii MF-1 TaxID=1389203 RepID=A0A9Q3EG87_9BASI|nr:hypothetical protein [Austropuccinia psidii MF-1]